MAFLSLIPDISFCRGILFRRGKSPCTCSQKPGLAQPDFYCGLKIVLWCYRPIWRKRPGTCGVSVAEYDLVIIGSGAAGFSAAARAKRLGLSRVAVIERGTMWGTCVNYGCIPSKYLITLAEIAYYKNYGHAGLRVSADIDLREALAGKQAFIDRLLARKEEALLVQPGVEIIRGSAAFISPTGIRVGDQTIASPRFIIATGSSPSVPDVEGIGTIEPMTNTGALAPEKIPDRLIVVGGRALGLEFAQLYAHLGSKVTVLQRSSRIVPEEEPALAEMLAGYLREEGIDIRTGVTLTRVSRNGDEVLVSIATGGRGGTISGTGILFATGRSPNTADLRLDLAGVNTGRKGEVLVDATLRTSNPRIWAAGDVLGEPQLEPHAKVGGSIAAENAVAGKNIPFDRSALPHAIFTTPQLAGVGMTEDQARDAGLPVISRCFRMSSLAKSAIMGDTRGMVKIVADGSGRVLGMHICAPIAAEMIQEGIVAVRNRLTVRELADTPHLFPTATEAIWSCARAFAGEPSGDYGPEDAK